jgi:hypothetical protein
VRIIHPITRPPWLHVSPADIGFVKQIVNKESRRPGLIGTQERQPSVRAQSIRHFIPRSCKGTREILPSKRHRRIPGECSGTKTHLIRSPERCLTAAMAWRFSAKSRQKKPRRSGAFLNYPLVTGFRGIVVRKIPDNQPKENLVHKVCKVINHIERAFINTAHHVT